jgi:uncharacterized membrane protein YesL
VGNFFDPDSGIMFFLSKVADIFLLSILWLICSLPLVTIGAATTALYYTAVKVIRRERSYIIQSFFRSFRENFFDATLLWLLLFIISAILGINFSFSRGMISTGTSKGIGFVLMVVYSLAALVVGFTALYMLPVLSRFRLKKRQILKMSLFMSIRHLPYTVLLAGIVLFMIAGTLYLPAILLFSPAAGAVLYSLPMERILRQYVRTEDADGLKDEWYLE